jgi:hypothetical protein
MGRLFLPKPTNPIAKAQALRFHNRQVSLGKEIPHFFDENGVRFYIDRRGASSGGGQYFRNLGSKLAVEAGRQQRAAERTPTIEDYQSVYGDKLGKDLFKAERIRLSQMYSNYNPSTQDIDHIDSMASGGMNISRNLRPMDASKNRSEGARKLTPEQKTAVLSGAPDVRTAIRQQGPVMTTQQTNKFLDTGKAWIQNAAAALGYIGSGLAYDSKEMVQQQEQAINEGSPLPAPHISLVD